MPSEDFINVTAPLRDLGGGRVWSLMISLFGDLAQGQDDVIDGPVLTAMMNMLHVKPEAARVALHRLRNDGWITSVKQGRISQHSLTEKGRTQSAAASPLIYAQPEATEQGWQLVLMQHADPDAQATLIADGFMPLLNRVYLGPVHLPAPRDALCLSGTDAPDWLASQLEPEGLRSDYTSLCVALGHLQANLPDPATISTLQTAVLRGLVVHNWRRLVLKHPALPTALVARDWPGRTCHRLVSDLLTLFPRPALTALKQEQAAA